MKNFNKFSYYITNPFKYNLNNGVIEDINNLIRYIKELFLATFYHFETRIILITGIYKYN